MEINQDLLKKIDLFVCNSCGHVDKAIRLLIDQESNHKICPNCYRGISGIGVDEGNGFELYNHAKQFIDKFIADKNYREFINKENHDRYLALKSFKKKMRPADSITFKRLDRALKIIEYCKREFKK